MSAVRSLPLAPSGQQIDLRARDHHAVIVEVSGGLRSYEVEGQPLLDGYGPGEMCAGARGQLLVPWPNRLRDGRYDFDGESLQVPLSEPEKHNAIHGFLRWEPWRVVARADDRVVVEHLLHAREGYPFAVRFSAEYRLEGGGLLCEFAATNVGERACPYGMGAHPYLWVPSDSIDECRLEAPGSRWLTEDDQSIPVGIADVDAGAYDFRVARPVSGTRLDTAFTIDGRDADGRAWVRLWSRDGTKGVGLWMDERYRYYMLFTGDTLGDESRRRRSLGVEPMTCAPNAFVSGDGLIVLRPGESVRSRWGIMPLAQSR